MDAFYLYTLLLCVVQIPFYAGFTGRPSLGGRVCSSIRLPKSTAGSILMFTPTQGVRHFLTNTRTLQCVVCKENVLFMFDCQRVG